MKWFRQCDRRYPFFWESVDQPAARWHGRGEGPVQYLASTPEGAWAEFLRHEEITDPDDLKGVSRALWVVEDEEEALTASVASLAVTVMTGGEETYPACQAEARRLRDSGAQALLAPSAALAGGTTVGYTVCLGFRRSQHEARILVLFGARPHLVGWLVVWSAQPPAEVLARVRHLPARS